MDLDLTQRTERNVPVLAATGEVDVSTSVQLQAALWRIVDDNTGRSAILDLRGVASMDAVGIGIIVGGLARATRQGGDIILVVDPKSRLRVMLCESRLDRAFAVHDTALAAAESVD